MNKTITKPKKFYTCKSDIAFKEIFGNIKNKNLLIWLLERILQVSIDKLTYLNVERNNNDLVAKRKRLDILVETNVGRINIEMNATNKEYLHPRNFCYLSNIYNKNTSISEDYNEDTLTIQINFTYGIKDDNKILRIYKVQDDEQKCYIKNFEIYEYNMDIIMNFWYSLDIEKVTKYSHLIMLDLGKNSLQELVKYDGKVDEYMEKITKLNTDANFWEVFTPEEDERYIRNTIKIESEKKGEKIGTLKGERKKSREIAKNMLAMQIDIDTIAKATNLSLNEIMKLQ